MDAIYRVLGWPLGWVMWLCYQITHNYGIALLIFTIIIRAILFPLSLKQQKSTIRMQMIKPQMDELQAKYKNNREKLNEEMMALYQKEGYNPASGCLPLLVQMPVLFGLIEVIYRPLKHILHIPADIITSAEKIAVNLHPEKFHLKDGFAVDQVDKVLKNLNPAQIYITQDVQTGSTSYGVLGNFFANVQNFDLSFLGMNLGEMPALSMFKDILGGIWNPVILIPILSGVSALFLSLISMKIAPQSDAAGANSAMKGMMFMMPVFSTVIAFQVPAGVGLYWFFSNIVALAQSLVLNKYYNPKEMAEKAKAEMEERREKERLERIEAKKLAKEKGDDIKEKALSQKEINRRKLAEARKRDAEKYGEVYVEVTDDDLR